jgi:MoaA/NifB/PqqE/SkfB family radical SAM enzyme
MNFENIKLNIENNPRCTLECSLCKRTTYFRLNNTKNVPGIDLSLKDFKKCLDFFKGGFTFCGQLSDPIFNKDFIEMLKMCNDNKIVTHINTAATGRKEDWYKKAFSANLNTKWTFGIDGPPHLSHLYRKNQNGEFLFEMMILAKEMGLKVYWQYIVFDFNEKYLEDCKKYSKLLKIDMEILYSQRNLKGTGDFKYE